MKPFWGDEWTLTSNTMEVFLWWTSHFEMRLVYTEWWIPLHIDRKSSPFACVRGCTGTAKVVAQFVSCLQRSFLSCQWFFSRLYSLLVVGLLIVTNLLIPFPARLGTHVLCEFPASILAKFVGIITNQFSHFKGSKISSVISNRYNDRTIKVKALQSFELAVTVS